MLVENQWRCVLGSYLHQLGCCRGSLPVLWVSPATSILKTWIWGKWSENVIVNGFWSGMKHRRLHSYQHKYIFKPTHWFIFQTAQTQCQNGPLLMRMTCYRNRWENPYRGVCLPLARWVLQLSHQPDLTIIGLLVPNYDTCHVTACLPVFNHSTPNSLSPSTKGKENTKWVQVSKCPVTLSEGQGWRDAGFLPS